MHGTPSTYNYASGSSRPETGDIMWGRQNREPDATPRTRDNVIAEAKPIKPQEGRDCEACKDELASFWAETMPGVFITVCEPCLQADPPVRPWGGISS